MLKKILVASVLLTMFPTAALASHPVVIGGVDPHPHPEILPFPRPWPWPQHFSVKPGSPLHLEGCRNENSSGKGVVSFSDYRGNVSLGGAGQVWIKKEPGTKWKKSGFVRIRRAGDWILFRGEGKFYAEGSSLDLKFLGKGELEAHGCGVSNYRGWWEVDVWRKFWPLPLPWPIPDPDPIPLPIKVQTGKVETEGKKDSPVAVPYPTPNYEILPSGPAKRPVTVGVPYSIEVQTGKVEWSK